VGAAYCHYISHSDGSLSRLPASHYDAFWRGERRLGSDHNPELRVVSLVTDFEHRRPARVLNHSFILHRLGRRGFISEEHKLSAGRTAVEMIGEVCEGLSPYGSPPSNVRSMAGRLARKRLASEHRWQPSHQVLDSLCTDMNRRAGRVVIQHAGGNLVY